VIELASYPPDCFVTKAPFKNWFWP